MGTWRNWFTRTTQNRIPSGLWVRVPPCPQMTFRSRTKPYNWNPKLAYAVGLLVTDGCLSNDGRHILLTSKDVQLLHTFLDCVDSTHIKIGKNRNGRGQIYHRIQFGNITFYQWLQEIGLTPNKTLTIGEINIPDKYIVDFVRGHLDGDGSITTYMDRYNTYKDPKYVYERLWVRFLSASRIHIEWLQKRIEKNLDVKGRIHKTKPRDNKRVPMYILKYGKKESTHLLKQLYYNDKVPCLHRKREVAEKFI